MVLVVFIDMTLKMLIKFVQITNSYSLQTGLGLVLVGIPPSLGHSTNQNKGKLIQFQPE